MSGFNQQQQPIAACQLICLLDDIAGLAYSIRAEIKPENCVCVCVCVCLDNGVFATQRQTAGRLFFWRSSVCLALWGTEFNTSNKSKEIACLLFP